MTSKVQLHEMQGPGWKTELLGAVTVYSKGHFGPLDDLVSWLESDVKSQNSFNRLTSILLNAESHFGLILESESHVLAVVDTIRSTPLFYTDVGAGIDFCAVSCSARDLLKHCDAGQWDPDGLQLLKLAGYVTGDKTTHAAIKQLLPGSCVLLDKTTGERRIHRYYRYFPESEDTAKSESEWMTELGQVMDSVFRRLIERAAGRPIVVPLSGGFDSRIILCKLHELGYANLSAISYGAPGNAQATRAEIICRTLDIPWRFIPSSAHLAREHFQSQRRRDYWAFSDNLCTLPSMQEFEALVELKEQGALPNDAIIINGQTGDFLTGGHIPKAIFNDDFDVNQLIEYTIGKHFGVFPDALDGGARDYLRDYLKQEFVKLHESDSPSKTLMAASFESLEWQERQSKYVVNGQRIYDFLGYGWELPLWDLELMRFIEQVPLSLRYRQKLFRSYLLDYDYQGLFKREYPAQASYTSTLGLIGSKLSSLIRKLGFDNRSLAAWNHYHYGHYRTYYRMFDYPFFKRNIPIYGETVPPAARWVVALLLVTWFEENEAGPIH